jgi:hypothetical protein
MQAEMQAYGAVAHIMTPDGVGAALAVDEAGGLEDPAEEQEPQDREQDRSKRFNS